MIYGYRIKQAREYCGLTQSQLAEKVGVNQSAIAQLETGRKNPTDILITRIAERTGFNPSYFFKAPINDFPIGTLSFRARQSLSSNELNKAYQHANVLFEYAQKISTNFILPSINLPLLNCDPVKAALVTRQSFGLPSDTPIRNLMLTVEKNGVLLLVLPIVLSKIDAFSTWSNILPVIIVSTGKPSDRTRFSIAHELGHLVIHKARTKTIPEMEREADIFAAEFLLPEKAMRREIHLPITLSNIARLKPRWGVSIQALIRRARDLELITERQYRYLFEQLSQRGWRVKEPPNLDIPKEKPRLISKMINELYKDSSILESIAKDMNLSKENATELIKEYLETKSSQFIGYQTTFKQRHEYHHN